MVRSTLHIYRAVLLWMVLDTAHGQTITSTGNFVVGQNKSLTCSIASGAQIDPNAPFPLSWPINATKVVSVQEQTTAGQISTYISTLIFTVDVKDNLVPFTCTARFIGTETTDVWVLYVIKPPNKPIVTGPTEVIGDRNSSWTCVVDGGSTSAPNLFWQFGNGSRIMSNNVLTANVYTDENKLEINNATAVLTLRVPAGNPSFDLGCVYVHSASSTQDTTYISINVTYPPIVTVNKVFYIVNNSTRETIKCQASALPAVTSVTWYKNGAMLNVSSGRYLNGSVTTPSLTILSVGKEDTGVYVCSASNLIGSTNGSLINVTVKYLPVVTYNNSIFTGILGTDLTLVCFIDSVPPFTAVTWWRIDNSTRTKSFINTTYPVLNKYSGSTSANPSLTILTLVSSDAGLYRCGADNDLGHGEGDDVGVQVFYLPRVDSGNSNITRHEKESVTIPCNFTAVPPVTAVTWLRDNNVINVNLPLNKYGGGNLLKPALTILDLRSTDVGMYKCKVTNNIGSAESRSVNLIVEYKPEISTVPEIVGEMTSPVTIYCNVSAYPWLSSLVWYRDDQPLNTSNTDHFSGGSTATPSLTITRPGAYDEGIYYCVASNTMGSTAGDKTKLSVNYLPVFRIDNPEVSGSLGQSVSLTVYVTARPNVTSIRWLRSSNSTTNFLELNVLGNSAKYGGGTKDSASLQIRSFEKSDEGIYVVEATNPVGPKNSSSFNVQISYPPSDLMIQGLTTGDYKEGESIVLTCSAKGLPPPQYRWYRSSVFKSDGAVLNITSATSADNTVFKCEALNTRGSAVKTVTVSVQYKPRPASNLTNETAAIGQTVQLTCETDSNPAPNNYTWYHNNLVVGTGSKTLTVTMKNNAMLGSYICIASNTHGEIDPHVVIYVTNKKKNDISSTGTSFERTGLSTFAVVLISVYCCCADTTRLSRLADMWML